MPTGTTRLTVALLALGMLLGGPKALGAQGDQPAVPAAPPQPSYDVIRLQHDGAALPYNVFTEWLPLLVTTPDGGAWAFFSAQARTTDGLGSRRLYASRFDPAAGVWLPAAALPGGEIQFGPAAAVDKTGTVHLVFSDRAKAAPDAMARLVYTRTDGAGGWIAPVEVAPHADAGHQMMPALALDGDDRPHVIWRDQRNLPPEIRAIQAANADVFVSDLIDGA